MTTATLTMTADQHDTRFAELIEEYTAAIKETLLTKVDNASAADKENIDCNKLMFYITSYFTADMLRMQLQTSDTYNDFEHVASDFISATVSAYEMLVNEDA